MKKFRTLSIIFFGILASVMLGACSCKKNSTVSVHTISATIEVTDGVQIVSAERDNYRIQVVEGTTFTMNYEIRPSEANNTKVTFHSSDSNIVRVSGATSTTGVTGAGQYTAQAYNALSHETTIRVTTDDGGYNSIVYVNVQPNPSPLDSVEGLTYSFENNRVEWNEVDGAQGYALQINGQTYLTTNNYYTGLAAGELKFESGGTYNIRVLAKGDTVHTLDSATYSTPIEVNILETPQITQSLNGALTWGEVENATSYTVYNGDNALVLSTEATNISLTNYYDSLDRDTRQFAISIVASSNRSSDTVFYVPSSKSDVKRIIWLDAPSNVRLSSTGAVGEQAQDSISLWGAVNGASGYNVKLSMIDTDITTNVYTIPTSLAAGKYTLTVQAIGNPEVTISDEHSISTFDFAKLPQVTLNVLDSRLSVDTTAITDPESGDPYVDSPDDAKDFTYELYFMQGGSVAKLVRLTRADNLSYNLSTSTDITSGAYTVYAKVVAVSGTAYANGIYSTLPVATGFTKLGFETISSISNEGVLTLNKLDNMSDTDSTYSITIDGGTEHEVNFTLYASSDNVDSTGTNTLIDLNVDASICMGTLSSGAHTVKVVPHNTRYVDCTESLCNTFTFNKLAAVTTNTLNHNIGKLSWPSITNAVSYKFVVNGNVKSTVSNEYIIDVADLVDDANSFSIVAIGNNRNYVNSNEYNFEITRLNKVSNIRVQDGVLTWDGIEGVTYYVNRYYDSSSTPQDVVPTTDNSFTDFSGTVDLTIYASQSGNFNSANSARFTINKLDRPGNIALVKGATNKITFAGTQHASGYVLRIARGTTQETYTYSSSDTLEHALASNLAGGDYNVSAYAIGDTNTPIADDNTTVAYVTSDYCTPFRFVKLATPTFTKLGGKVQWNVASSVNPFEYELDFGGTIPTQTLTATGRNGEYDFTTYNNGSSYVELPAGNYTFTIKAYAKPSENNNFVLDSDVSDSITITKYGKVEPFVEDGVIKFAPMGLRVEYQYSTDGDFSAVTYNNNNTAITINANVTPNEITINSNVVSSGYLRFIVIAGDGYATGSFGDSIHFEKMSAISGLSKRGTTLSWTGVTGATKYDVKDVTSTPQLVASVNAPSVSTTMENPTVVGKHYYKVFGIGSTYTTSQLQNPSTIIYLNNESSSYEVMVLGTVSNISLSNGMLSWDSYSVNVNGNVYPQSMILTLTDTNDNSKVYEYELNGTTRSFNLNEARDGDDNLLPSGTSYRATFKYIGNTHDVLDGNTSTYFNPTDQTQTIVKYVAPQPTVRDGQLQYQIVGGLSNISHLGIGRRLKGSVQDYDTLIPNNDFTLEIGLGGINYININLPRTDTEYELVFKTIAPATGLSSEFDTAHPLTVCRYSTVTDFRISQEFFMWTVHGTGPTYLIKETTGSGVTITSNSENGKEPAPEMAEGAYNFCIMANGTATFDGNGTAYLNSSFSSQINVNYIGQVQNISLASNTLSWQAITGIGSYEVTLTNTENTWTHKTETNSVSVDVFKNKLLEGATNTFSVKAVSTSSDEYILTSTDVDNSADMYCAPKIKDLHVENGQFAWTIDVAKFLQYYIAQGGTPSMSNIAQLARDLANNNASDEDKETYKPFYAFTIKINNVDHVLDPTTSKSYNECVVDMSGSMPTVTFLYSIADNVKRYTTYTVSVRANGNTATQEDEIPMVVASGFSTDLTAVKSPSPETTIIRGGKISFALLADNASHTYVKDYIMSAAPSTPGSAAPDPIIINLTDEQIEELRPGYMYTHDLSPNNNPWLSKNVTYSLTVTSLGTQDSRTLASGATIFLRSSNYTTQQVNFLADIDTITYTDTSDVYGGYLSWRNNIGRMQEVYFVKKTWYNENALDGEGHQKPIDEWLTKENTSDHIYFLYEGINTMTFIDPIRNEEDGTMVTIPDGDYYVGMRLQGDNSVFIASDTIIFQGNEFTKLATVTQYNSSPSWVRDGWFYWNPVENVSRYTVTVVEENPAGVIVKTYNSVITTNNYYELPNNIGSATNKFRLKIVPLGQETDKKYLSGDTKTTLAYFPLATPELSFNVETNVASWQSISNAYEVVVDGVSAVVVTNSVNIDDAYDLDPTLHSIEARALSSDNQHLHSKYSSVITIVKLADPELWVQKTEVANASGENHVRPGAVVTWKLEDEVLNFGRTNVRVYAANDETGSYSENNKKIDVTFDNTLDNAFYDISNIPTLPQGYYTFVVKFINGDSSSSVITLASNEAQIVVYKQAAPVVLDGDYYTQEQIDSGEYDDVRPTTFTNYLKWALVNDEEHEETNYTVKVYTDSTLTGAPLKAYDTVRNANKFEIKTIEGVRTMFLDLSEITQDDVYVVVASMGEILSQTTTVNPDVLGFIASNYSTAHHIMMPINRPVIVSTAAELTTGIIKWNNEYDCNIELLLNFTYKPYDSNVTTDEVRYVVLQVEGGQAPEEYHLPYVSSEYTVLVRYVRSCYASPYSEDVPAQMTLFASGSGTSTDPYIIYNNSPSATDRNADILRQMQNISYYPNAHYALRSNFAMPNNTNWEAQDFTFGGVFSAMELVDHDGNTTERYYQISNVNMANKNGNALFKNVTGTIKDLRIEFNTSISGSSSQQTDLRMGGVVYTNNGTLSNIIVSGEYSIDITRRNIYFGPLAYENNATITACSSSAEINIRGNSTTYVGGLVCYNNATGSITNGKNSGEYTVTSVSSGNYPAALGGIAYTNAGTITNCEVYGDMHSNSFGGVAYTNSGTVQSSAFYGSLVADEYSESGTNTYYYSIYIGGVVARNSGEGVVQGCYAVFTANTFTLNTRSGNTNATVGGLIGRIDQSSVEAQTIANCYVVFDVTIVGGKPGTDVGFGIVVGNATYKSSAAFSRVYYNPTTSDPTTNRVFGIGGEDQNVKDWTNGSVTLPNDINVGLDGYSFVTNSHYGDNSYATCNCRYIISYNN